MSQGSRPDRVAEQIRSELASLLAREVHDPGIGFVTLTRVQISPDLQSARVFYTALGDGAARRNSARALERAAPFLRRQIGSRLRLKRVPELKFLYDESIAGQDRIEQLLNEIRSSAGGPSELDSLEPASRTNVRDASDREWVTGNAEKVTTEPASGSPSPEAAGLGLREDNDRPREP
ncbi:MAG: 30S ribosome-binding factor RbfA [Acidobacteria bacterium]|nr:MAG: 30S ribosome-binding factor RbfA [Acidobacteriota bacterium]